VDVIDAIADPVRRDILVMLHRQPLAAGAIAAAFPISRPAISRHLRVLRAHGLVVNEVDAGDGRGRVYRLDAGPLAEVEAWLTQFHDDWSSRLDALETEVHRARRDRRRAASTDARSDQTRSTA